MLLMRHLVKIWPLRAKTSSIFEIVLKICRHWVSLLPLLLLSMAYIFARLAVPGLQSTLGIIALGISTYFESIQLK